ncbi:MAG: ParB/RepB/Spo0J family partition protein [Deltaproteobacteria bacterium]|nr:ParB/RepB/Spo0J family partition protein [Deltaproteobacteria bacterium]
MQIIEIPINKIRISQKHSRTHTEEYIRALSDSIKEIGLLNLVTVKRVSDGYELKAGKSRFLAVKSIGWETIPVVVIDIDDLRGELVEIDENLIRNDLTALEKAEYLKRRKDIYEELYTEAKEGEARKKGLKQYRGDTRVATETFSENTASSTGLSRRSIQRELQIAEKINGDVKDLIRNTPLENNKTALLKLARLDGEKQKETVKSIIEGKKKGLSDKTKPANSKEAAAPEHILKSLKASIDTILGYTKEDHVFTEKLQNFLLTNLSGIKKLTAFLPSHAKAEFGASLLKETLYTVKAGDKVDEAMLEIFKKAKRVCSAAEKLGATGSSQADSRIKELTDWYYHVWDNNPPEKVNGNGGGRVAKIFNSLLEVLEEKKTEDPADYIKNLYTFYKNTSPGLLGKKEDQWLFGDSVKSLIKFRAKFADIEVYYIKKKGVHIGNPSRAGVVGAKEGQTIKTGAFGFPQHILDRNKSSGTQVPKT